MKILLTIGDITLKGGAERVVTNLANAYAQIGLDVEILSFYKSVCYIFFADLNFII